MDGFFLFGCVLCIRQGASMLQKDVVQNVCVVWDVWLKSRAKVKLRVTHNTSPPFSTLHMKYVHFDVLYGMVFVFIVKHKREMLWLEPIKRISIGSCSSSFYPHQKLMFKHIVMGLFGCKRKTHRKCLCIKSYKH